MVNNGRRNNACQLCKERKVKCDETAPSCLRCEKYGRPCPGVGVLRPKGLRWRNVLPSQEAKPPAEESKPVAPAPPVDQEPLTVFESHVIRFFFLKYVSSSGYLAHLEPTYNICMRPSALQHIVTALAISRYAHHTQAKQMHAVHALRQYQSSLRALRAALQNPHIARQNETLSAVLLIIAFETSLCHSDSVRASAARDAHSIGALSLLRHRGPNQFRYPLSLRLFREVRNQIFINLAFQPAGLQLLYDPTFDWFGDRGCLEPDEMMMNSRLVEAAWGLPMLRERAEHLSGAAFMGASAEIDEIESLLQRISAVDERLNAWRTALPQSWRPHPLMASDSDDEEMTEPERVPGWLGIVTTFDSLIAATINNNYHVLRLLLAVTALDTVARLKSVDPLALHAAAETQRWQNQLISLIDGICASVPFQTGRFPDMFAGPDPRDEQTEQEPMMRHALGAHMVYFPLAVILAQSRVPEERRKWVQEQMDYIQEVHGFNLSQDLGGETTDEA